MARPSTSSVVSPMSPADTTVLHLDDPAHPMLVTGVLAFSGPVDWDRLVPTLLARLLEGYPRFRQRVVEPVGGLVPLVAGWQDVDLVASEHLTRVRLPAPGNRGALAGLVSEVMSTPLDRDRPLWHLHLVDGFTEAGPRGAAIVARLHHAIADGTALAEVLLSLTDREAGDDPAPPADPPTDVPSDAPQDAPEGSRAFGSGLSGSGLFGAGLVGALWNTGRRVTSEVLRHPDQVLRLPREAVGLGLTLGRLLALPNDPPTVFRGSLQPAKQAAWSRPAPLPVVKRLARATGSTVNDVLLAVAAGALRRYSLARGETPHDVRAAVPVNLRLGSGPVPASLGNQFGLVVVPLPVGVADPVQRVHAVRRTTAELKAGQQALVTYGLVNALGALPRAIAERAVNLVGQKVSVIVTNVPGPRETVTLAGHAISQILFWVPQLGGIALGVSIFSYADEVTIGVASDASVIGDPAQISGWLHRELEELSTALAIDLTAASGTSAGGRDHEVDAMSLLPSIPTIRGFAIEVLDQAESLSRSAVIAVREVQPTTVAEVVDAVERVPALVAHLATALTRVDRIERNADDAITHVEQTRQQADVVLAGAGLLMQRAALLLAQAESMASRAGTLLGSVEGPVERLVPALQALADLSEPALPELLTDLAQRWPGLLTHMSDDVVPALTAMQDAVPDLLAIRELAHRLEPLFYEVSETMSGFPGAKRARRRGAKDREPAGRTSSENDSSDQQNPKSTDS